LEVCQESDGGFAVGIPGTPGALLKGELENTLFLCELWAPPGTEGRKRHMSRDWRNDLFERSDARRRENAEKRQRA
jgi:hypothetical protein